MKRGPEQQELREFLNGLREVLGLNPLTWTTSEALKGNTNKKGKTNVRAT